MTDWLDEGRRLHQAMQSPPIDADEQILMHVADVKYERWLRKYATRLLAAAELAEVVDNSWILVANYAEELKVARTAYRAACEEEGTNANPGR